ncbi:MAG: endospore germination permease [Solibacillus sp.]
MNKISILHLLLLAMTFIGLKNHVTILPALLENGGRDSWLAVILGAVVMIPWIFLLLFIHKQSKGEHIRNWLERRIGKRLTAILFFVTAAYLLLLAAVTMRETLQWFNISFLPDTPPIVLLVIFSILCMTLATMNILTITMVNSIVLFGVLVLGFFVAIVNIPIKDHTLLKPFLEHGMSPVVSSMVYAMSGYIELTLLLFLQHYIKKPLRSYHLLLILAVLAGLTLGPLIGAITEFGPKEAAELRYPAYEEWTLATIGQYFEHMDFFSAYQWLTGAFIRVGILLFIIVEMYKWTEQKKRIWTNLAMPFFVLCCILFFVNEEQFLIFDSGWFLIMTACFFGLLSVILFIAVLKKEKPRQGAPKHG